MYTPTPQLMRFIVVVRCVHHQHDDLVVYAPNPESDSIVSTLFWEKLVYSILIPSDVMLLSVIGAESVSPLEL
jgi:hypothetical protein